MAIITLRPATPADIPQLQAVMISAFRNTALDSRVWPPSDPRTGPDQIAAITQQLPGITVAEEEITSNHGTKEKIIQGWASWFRREADRPAATVNPADFPSSGDRDLAVRFFQNNADQSRALAPPGLPHWFLSIMVVRTEAQRKGVGAALLTGGLRTVDEEGLVALVNGSKEGRGLYERHGFRTITDTPFEHGIHSFHMRREVGGEDR